MGHGFQGEEQRGGYDQGHRLGDHDSRDHGGDRRGHGDGDDGHLEHFGGAVFFFILLLPFVASCFIVRCRRKRTEPATTTTTTTTNAEQRRDRSSSSSALPTILQLALFKQGAVAARAKLSLMTADERKRVLEHFLSSRAFYFDEERVRNLSHQTTKNHHTLLATSKPSTTAPSLPPLQEEEEEEDQSEMDLEAQEASVLQQQESIESSSSSSSSLQSAVVVGDEADDVEEATTPRITTQPHCKEGSSCSTSLMIPPCLETNDDNNNVPSDLACSVCFEEFTETDKVVHGSACSHLYRYDCLLQWMEKGSEHCPICRKDLLTSTEMFRAAVKTLGYQRVQALEKTFNQLHHPHASATARSNR